MFAFLDRWGGAGGFKSKRKWKEANIASEINLLTSILLCFGPTSKRFQCVMIMIFGIMLGDTFMKHGDRVSLGLCCGKTSLNISYPHSFVTITN